MAEFLGLLCRLTYVDRMTHHLYLLQELWLD